MEEINSDPRGIYATMEEDLKRWEANPPPALKKWAEDNKKADEKKRQRERQLQQQRQREREQQPPPTPQLRDSLPAPSNDQPLSEGPKPEERNTKSAQREQPRVRTVEEIGRELERRRAPRSIVLDFEREREGRSQTEKQQTSDSGEQASSSRQAPRSRRNSEERTRKNFEQFINNVERQDNKVREHPQGDDGGVALKPLTKISPSATVGKRPGLAGKRGVNIAGIDPCQTNNFARQETEWMTEDEDIRNWAQYSQEELYGDSGRADYNTNSAMTLMRKYPEPTRDLDTIEAYLHHMTRASEQYQAGGPPECVDMSNVNYFSDVSNVQSLQQLNEARSIKGHSGYAMFTEREHEIEVMRRLQVHGFLKEGVEIKYGWQEKSPHGGIAWLTREGQEIGGRMREQYEHERAVEGKNQFSPAVLRESEVEEKALRCCEGVRLERMPYLRMVLQAVGEGCSPCVSMHPPR